MEDVHHLQSNGVEDAYLFTVHSSRRNLDVYPDPNEYVIRFDSPFRNVVGFEVVQALLPRSQYLVDTHNHRLVVYVAETRFEVYVPVGEYTHATLLDALRAVLHPLGVTASFQDRGRNVFELSSDRILKLDVLESSLARLLGFNTQAEYPDLERVPVQGESVEHHAVDHTWLTKGMDTSSWVDRTRPESIAFALFEEGSTGTATTSITPEHTFAIDTRALSASFRYAHDTYTPFAFRLPRRLPLLQSPHGFEVHVGLNEWSVRRYVPFDPKRARRGFVQPLVPESEIDLTHLHRRYGFELVHALDASIGDVVLVPSEGVYTGDELFGADAHPLGEEGLVLTHVHRPGWFDVRDGLTNALIRTEHVRPDTNLVDVQAYIAATFRYHTVEGTVPLLRYGTHPADERQGGYIQVSMRNQTLVVDRVVEETVEQVSRLDLVASIHDLDGGEGFSEPEIEGTDRYASQLSTEYTVHVNVPQSEWSQHDVRPGTFHRFVVFGQTWTCRIGSYDSPNEDDETVTVPIQMYDRTRTLSTLIQEVAQRVGVLGTGVASAGSDWSMLVSQGIVFWMRHVWGVIAADVVATSDFDPRAARETFDDLVAASLDIDHKITETTVSFPDDFETFESALEAAREAWFEAPSPTFDPVGDVFDAWTHALDEASGTQTEIFSSVQSAIRDGLQTLAYRVGTYEPEREGGFLGGAVLWIQVEDPVSQRPIPGPLVPVDASSFRSVWAVTNPSLHPGQILENVRIDGVPSVALVASFTPSPPVELNRPVYTLSNLPDKKMPPFKSNTEIEPNTPGWTNTQAWVVDSSSFSAQPPFLALNTTNTSASDGWRSGNKLSPDSFPSLSTHAHSSLFYYRRPSPNDVDTLLEGMKHTEEVDLASTGVSPDLTFEPFASLGPDWDQGAGGPNVLESPGDARVPAVFACRLTVPSSVDTILNTVVCAIGDDALAMAVGFDAEGALFARAGRGRSMDPRDTSYVSVDPRDRTDMLGHQGWLAWFLVPSPFGVQIALYWNGSLLGSGSRTSSDVTRWAGSGSGGYLQFSAGRNVRPWSEQTPHWIRARHASLPFTVVRYRIETINDNREDEYTFPRAFRLEGSTDGTRWTVLDRRTVSQWSPRTQRDFDVETGGLYTHFRLRIESSNRTFVSIGQWDMTLVPANEEKRDLFDAHVLVLGPRNAPRVSNLDELELVPRVTFTDDEGETVSNTSGFVRSSNPVLETGVALESKVYVLRSQNPERLIRRGARVVLESGPDSLPLRVEAIVTDQIRPQGTHPSTGTRTDGVSWFTRFDTVNETVERYRVNDLVESGSIRVFRSERSERSERTVIYSNLVDETRYTLTIRLLPDGTLRYVVMEGTDANEYEARFYTLDPVPVTGLRDGFQTGRIPGFESAALVVPRTDDGVQTRERASVLERLYAWTGTSESDLFVPLFDYQVQEFGSDGVVRQETVRVSDESTTFPRAFPITAFRSPSESSTFEWTWNPHEAPTSEVRVRAIHVHGTRLDRIDPASTWTFYKTGDPTHAYAPERAFESSTRLTFEWIENMLKGPITVRWETTDPVAKMQVWTVTAWMVDVHDPRACFVSYAPRTFAPTVRHAFLLDADGTVLWLNGEDTQAEPVEPIDPLSGSPSMFVEPTDLRVTVPDSSLQGSQFGTERIEWAHSTYAQNTFEDTFRFRETSVFAYSRSVGPGGTYTREYVSTGSNRLETREAFRWIQYFTIEDIELEDVSLHTLTLMFPDDDVFERTIPLTLTLRDENSNVLDEFTTFWNGPEETDSEGRVIATFRGTERLGPFTGLSSIVVAYDPFRTSRDVRLRRGVRYSFLVSTLDVYITETDESVSEIDRAFPIRVPFTASGNGVLGYIATYEEETHKPAWMDGFVPFRMRTARVEHRLTSPGITTLSPDSFVKLSIPEIEQQVHVHRNYDEWTGGVATFFLSPKLEHKEFHEHMHVGLVKRFFPLSRLDQLTIRFLNEDNQPYNFRGVNHVLRLVVRYLMPKWDPVPSPSTGHRTSMIELETDEDVQPSRLQVRPYTEREAKETTDLVRRAWVEMDDAKTPDDMVRVLRAYAHVLQKAGRTLDQTYAEKNGKQKVKESDIPRLSADAW